MKLKNEKHPIIINQPSDGALIAARERLQPLLGTKNDSFNFHSQPYMKKAYFYEQSLVPMLILTLDAGLITAPYFPACEIRNIYNELCKHLERRRASDRLLLLSPTGTVERGHFLLDASHISERTLAHWPGTMSKWFQDDHSPEYLRYPALLILLHSNAPYRNSFARFSMLDSSTYMVKLPYFPELSILNLVSSHFPNENTIVRLLYWLELKKSRNQLPTDFSRICDSFQLGYPGYYVDRMMMRADPDLSRARKDPMHRKTASGKESSGKEPSVRPGR